MRNFIAFVCLILASFTFVGPASAQQGVHPHNVTGGTLRMAPDRPHHIHRMPSMQRHMEARGVGRPNGHSTVIQSYQYWMNRPLGGYARPKIREHIIILRMRMRPERRMF
jgi:hypothetical protein